jgi:hypothetical protein
MRSLSELSLCNDTNRQYNVMASYESFPFLTKLLLYITKGGLHLSIARFYYRLIKRMLKRHMVYYGKLMANIITSKYLPHSGSWEPETVNIYM